MSLESVLIFAGALFVAAATPGPGIAALVGRVLGRGSAGAAAFAIGLALGDVVWLAFAVAGLSALAQAFQGVFLLLRFAGAAYLMLLAWRLWTAPVHLPDAVPVPSAEPAWRLGLVGLTVTLGNPKVMVFYLALLPNLVDVQAVTPLAFAELACVCLAVLGLVFGCYVVLAVRARRLLVTPNAVRLANRTSGTVMAGAAVVIATR